LSLKTDKLLNLEADKHAAIDNEVEDKGEEIGDLVYELVREVEERDVEFWISNGANPELTLNDYFAIPLLERDNEWSDSFAGMWTAAFYQAFYEIFGIEYLESVERRNERIATYSDEMSAAELVEAGKKGFGKADIQKARERRRTVS
jgi:hypothetical protein